MKQGLFTLILSSFFFIAEAQVTITNADMPSAGDQVILDNATPPQGLDLSLTGPNYTWDFSSVTSNSTDTTNFVSVGSTPFAYQFFFNNVFLYPNNKADVAIAGFDFPIPPQIPINITEVINYFRKPNSDYSQVGFGANISGLPSSIQYDPIDRILKFPAEFGNIDSARFQWFISVPTVGAYGQDKWRYNHADGWGTLILPNGATYQTLRVESRISGTDTLFLDLLGFGFAFASTSYEYRWYAPNESAPVLQINANGAAGNVVASSFTYKHTDPPVNPAGIPYAENFSLNTFSPNPVSDLARIQFMSKGGSGVWFSVYSSDGRLVKRVFEASPSAGLNTTELSFSDLAPGCYVLSMESEGFRGVKMFLKD
jgi:hypothetical protein